RVERIEPPFRLAMPDLDRAAARATRAYGGRGLQVPDACLVEKRPREQRADRTDIDDVVGVGIVVKRMVLGAPDQRRVAPLCDPQRVRFRYFFREAHAARAQ